MLDHAKEFEREGVASYMCHVGNLGGPAEMALFDKFGMLPRAVTVLHSSLRCPIEQSYFVLCSHNVRWHVVMKDFRRPCLQ